MAKFCGNCGSPINATAVFCGGCGSRVPGAPAAVSNPVAPAFAPPALTPDPVRSADDSGFATVSGSFPAVPAEPPSSGFSPLPASFTTEPVSAEDTSGFAPVSGSFASAPSTQPVSSGFASVPPSFAPTPSITPSTSGYAPVTGSPSPVAPSFASTPTNTPSTSGYAPWAGSPSPVPPSFAPTPTNTPSTSGYAPWAGSPASVAPSFTPPPAAPTTSAASAGYAPVTAAPSNPAPGSYAPIPGVSSPAPAAYGQAAGAYTPPSAAYTPGQAYAPGAAYPAAKKSNTLLKVVVAFVLVIFVGGALGLAGLWYAAQKIKAKAHAVTAQVLGGGADTTTSPDENTESAGGFKGDPCRFLSKAEVSQAVGLQVIRTEAANGGCSYIAKGDPADIAAKHTTAMLGGMGADAQAQKMAGKFASAFFAQQEAGDKNLSAEAAKGEVPVLALTFTSGHAALEMKMNRTGFNYVGGGQGAKAGGGDLTGVGDDAFVAGASAIMMRKGNTMVRMMYVSCPCNTSNVIPLAKTLASRM